MPTRARFPRMRFSRQILLLQIGVVVLVVGLGVTLVGVMLRGTLTEQYGQRALAIARSFATDPQVIAAAAARKPNDNLEQWVRSYTDPAVKDNPLFVVVTDDKGIRIAHPDPGALGSKVSTSAEEA